MTRTRFVAAAAIVLLIIAFGASAWHAAWAKAKKAQVEFAPDPEAEGAPPIDGETWFIETPDYVARVSRLGNEERLLHLREQAGAFVDPFHPGHGPSPAFLTFLLELRSRAQGSLVFQPQRCRLITNRKEHRQPLDRPAVESSYGLLGREVPEAYRAALPALLDGEAVLRSGEGVSGLLVFREIDAKTRSFVVQILVTNPQGEVIEVNMPYKRIKQR